MTDEVTVGNLESHALGSGARKSAGKFEWHQLPWFALGEVRDEYRSWCKGAVEVDVLDIVASMGCWQRGESQVLDVAIARLLYLLAVEQDIEHDPDTHVPLRALESTVRVLEFGAKKYAVGNWAKGMPWSVCFSCAMSHLAWAATGQLNDKESGLSHLAHAMCNLLFLKSYETLYPEGDDRILEFAYRTRRPALEESEHEKFGRMAADIFNGPFEEPIAPSVDVIIEDNP